MSEAQTTKIGYHASEDESEDEVPVIHKCDLRKQSIDCAIISDSVLRTMKLSGCDIVRAVLIDCDIRACVITSSNASRCEIVDTSMDESRVSDSRIAHSMINDSKLTATTFVMTEHQKCSMSQCSDILTPLALERFSPELRDHIFKFSIWNHLRPNGQVAEEQTTPPIVIALRRNKVYYAEAVKIYQQAYTLNVNDETRVLDQLAGEGALKNLRYFKLGCSARPSLVYLMFVESSNVQITLKELFLAETSSECALRRQLKPCLRTFQWIEVLRIQFHQEGEPWIDEVMQKLDTYTGVVGTRRNDGRSVVGIWEAKRGTSINARPSEELRLSRF